MNFLGPGVVYPLCLLTSVVCALMLARGYARTRARLLFWSAIGFGLLAVNNLLVVADMLVFAEIDLRLARQIAVLAALAVLLFAFIWESE